jgi:hypothetical protein
VLPLLLPGPGASTGGFFCEEYAAYLWAKLDTVTYRSILFESSTPFGMDVVFAQGLVTLLLP